jgi:phosphoserine phosphatase
MKAQFLALTALLLTACASAPTDSASPPPPQNLRVETDDLAMVSDMAAQMAGMYGKQDVLVVLDMDNTLLAMEQDLGSDQWYYWQKALARDNPCSGKLLSGRFAVQGALFYASAMRPTQPDAAEQVKRMQDAGLRVIVVTSRGPEYRLQTFRELRRNGFSFWGSALPPQQGYAEDFVPEGGERPARYEEGVFLTSGQDKGDMIRALLTKTGTTPPKVIIMADDKQSNLDDMMKAFSGSGTAVHGWRYTREDDTVAAFNAQQAADTWNAVKPALIKIERIFGTDNFDLPPDVIREGCGVMPEERE